MSGVDRPHIQFSEGRWFTFWRRGNQTAYHPEFERICQQAKVWWQMKQYDVIDGIPVRIKQDNYDY